VQRHQPHHDDHGKEADVHAHHHLRHLHLGVPGGIGEVEGDVNGLQSGAGGVDGDDEEAAGLEEPIEGPKGGAEEGGDVRQPPKLLRALVAQDPPESRNWRCEDQYGDYVPNDSDEEAWIGHWTLLLAL